MGLYVYLVFRILWVHISTLFVESCGSISLSIFRNLVGLHLHPPSTFHTSLLSKIVYFYYSALFKTSQIHDFSRPTFQNSISHTETSDRATVFLELP